MSKDNVSVITIWLVFKELFLPSIWSLHEILGRIQYLTTVMNQSFEDAWVQSKYFTCGSHIQLKTTVSQFCGISTPSI